MEKMPETLTVEQAANYLQAPRSTIYRHLRDGKLVASKVGRTYRILKGSLNLLLWTTPLKRNLAIREYTDDEVAGFLREDRLDDETRHIVKHFTRRMDEREAGQLGDALSKQTPTS